MESHFLNLIHSKVIAPSKTGRVKFICKRLYVNCLVKNALNNSQLRPLTIKESDIHLSFSRMGCILTATIKWQTNLSCHKTRQIFCMKCTVIQNPHRLTVLKSRSKIMHLILPKTDLWLLSFPSRKVIPLSISTNILSYKYSQIQQHSA